MAVNGYLKIKTKLDNSGIDKDKAELENKIKKLQTDNSNASQEERILQRQINKYNELTKKAEEYKQKMESLQVMKNGKLEVTDKGQMLNLQAMYSVANDEIEKQAKSIEKVHTRLQKVKDRQTENNIKISEFKQKIDQIEIKKVQNGMDTVGKKLQNSIEKLGRMTLAIAGIRTAWGAVKSAISMVSQYNPQMAVDFEYMRYCVANLLVPAVQWLIKLLYTVLSYVNAIASAWFGINLFSNSSAKNFQKMKNSAGGTAKAAKEIQKSLQGFDEMNILQDDGSTSGNTGTGIAVPSMDLSTWKAEVPAWLKWIIDNKDLILSVLAGIVMTVMSLKLGLGGIVSLGLGMLIGGIVYAVQSLLEYLKNPTFENLGKFIQGIGIAIIGLGAIIAVATGSLIGIVIGAIVLIWGTIVKYWDNIKAFFQGIIDWLTGKSDWVREMFGDTIGDIYDNFVAGLQDILDWFDMVFKGIKANFDEFIAFFKNIFAGDWKAAWQNVKNIFGNIWNSIVNTVKTMANIIGKIAINIGKTVGSTISGAFKAIVNGVMWAIENTLNAPIRAVNGLIDKVNQVPGINLGKINTFSLPRLARGGVIAQPTTAVIGEAGKEAIVPLENNTEGLELIADKIASKMGGSGIVNVYLDGKLIQRQMTKRSQQLAFARNGR